MSMAPMESWKRARIGRYLRVFARCVVLIGVPAASLAACGDLNHNCVDPAASCVFVSECGPMMGHLSPGECAEPIGTVCCTPTTACPEEDMECCHGSWTSRPACLDGAFTCPIGAVLAPRDGCGEDTSCERSGGTVATSSCCAGAEDFPNTCLIGACGCSPENSSEVAVCICPDGQCFDGSTCVDIQ